MKIYNQPMLSNVVLNTNINSQAEQLMEMFGYSIQVVITGVPTGTFKLQACDDPVQRAISGQPFPATNWTDIASSSVAVSAAGTIMFNVTDVFYNYVRLVYTDGSGGASTATATATFNGKGM